MGLGPSAFAEASADSARFFTGSRQLVDGRAAYVHLAGFRRGNCASHGGVANAVLSPEWVGGAPSDHFRVFAYFDRPVLAEHIGLTGKPRNASAFRFGWVPGWVFDIEVGFCHLGVAVRILRRNPDVHTVPALSPGFEEVAVDGEGDYFGKSVPVQLSCHL